MKNAIIYNYHGQDFKHITGYDHNGDIHYEDVFKIAEDIFNKGLNVMIVHSTSNGEPVVILYVDNKNFKQR